MNTTKGDIRGTIKNTNNADNTTTNNVGKKFAILLELSKVYQLNQFV